MDFLPCRASYVCWLRVRLCACVCAVSVCVHVMHGTFFTETCISHRQLRGVCVCVYTFCFSSSRAYISISCSRKHNMGLRQAINVYCTYAQQQRCTIRLLPLLLVLCSLLLRSSTLAALLPSATTRARYNFFLSFCPLARVLVPSPGMPEDWRVAITDWRKYVFYTLQRARMAFSVSFAPFALFFPFHTEV